MPNTYVVTGTLTNANTVTLDEPLPVSTVPENAVKVRVVIETLPTTRSQSPQKALDEIWARQRMRGHQPPTAEEVDAYLQTERDSWE